MEGGYEGQWALVTGAGRPRRIGAKIAERLARRGSNIYLHYRSDVTDAEAVRGDVLRAGGEKKALVELVQGELSDANEVAALFEHISPDIVILNAAVFEPVATPKDTALIGHLKQHDAALDQHFNANAKAALLVTEAALYKARQHNKHVTIVFVGDAFIEKGGAYPGNLTAYTMSKAYVTPIIREYAQQYGKDGFRFLAVLNGPVEPPRTAPEETVRKMRVETALPDTLLNPWIGGEAVAEAIDYLIQSKAVNGTAVFVDGGRSWTAGREH